MLARNKTGGLRREEDRDARNFHGLADSAQRRAQIEKLIGHRDSP
jgi:hypothetical protein